MYARKGWDSLARFLCSPRGDLAGLYFSGGKRLIHCAAQEALVVEVIEWLVNNSVVYPNRHTGYKPIGQCTTSTPLHLAIMYHRINPISTLLKMEGIYNVNRCNISGKTPWHSAANESDNGLSLSGDRFSNAGHV